MPRGPRAPPDDAPGSPPRRGASSPRDAAPTTTADASARPVTVFPTPTTMPNVVPTLEASHALQPGCFAWSPSTHSAACVVGSLGRDAAPARAWGVRFTGDPSGQSVSLLPAAGASPTAPRSLVPEASTLTAVRARLAREGYVTLTPLRHVIDSRDLLTWAPESTLRWIRARGATSTASSTDLLELHWGGDAGATVLEAWIDRVVPAPTLAMYQIPGGRYLVVEVLGDYGDDGGTGTIALAWTCDRETRTCQ